MVNLKYMKVLRHGSVQKRGARVEARESSKRRDKAQLCSHEEEEEDDKTLMILGTT